MTLAALVTAQPGAAATMSMEGSSHGRYLGPPDLALTSAMIAAGGGASHFHAKTLSAFLVGSHRDAEFASLTQRFGAQRINRYFATFDAFVNGAIGLVTTHHIALPHPSPRLTHDPRALATALRAAGVMPDGRFDVGYLIEHLISRPFHKTLMDKVNADPAIGPAVNADFHIILTAEMNDLRSLYHLPR